MQKSKKSKGNIVNDEEIIVKCIKHDLNTPEYFCMEPECN